MLKGSLRGHYWVSVQARQDVITSGFWLWHNRMVQANSGAVWQNSGNAFGTSCIIWIRKITCALLAQTAPDQVFRLIGTASRGTPPPTPSATPTSSVTPTPTATATVTPTGYTDDHAKAHAHAKARTDATASSVTAAETVSGSLLLSDGRLLHGRNSGR